MNRDPLSLWKLYILEILNVHSFLLNPRNGHQTAFGVHQSTRLAMEGLTPM